MEFIALDIASAGLDQTGGVLRAYSNHKPRIEYKTVITRPHNVTGSHCRRITFMKTGGHHGRLLRRILGASFSVTLLLLAVSWWILLASFPPPPAMPRNAGKIPGPPNGAVNWLPAIYDPNAKYGPCIRVLTVDGGGIRGVIPARILEKIETLTGRPTSKLFNFIAGTSTGALLTLGLTRPSDSNARNPAFTAHDMLQLYRDYSAVVFPTSWSFVRTVRRLLRPKYGPDGIDTVLDRYFSDAHLIEALTEVLVPGYDIEDQKRIWFSNNQSAAYDIYMKDLARGATAAPTYLPPSRFAVPPQISPKGYVALVDGGLFANNPALEALNSVSSLGVGTHSILLISIGSGAQPHKYTFEQAWRWGLFGWADPLLEIAFSDPAIENQIDGLVKTQGINYFRLQTDLSENVALDDATAVDRLIASTDKYLVAHREQIEFLAHILELPRAESCGGLLGPNYIPPYGPRKHWQISEKK